MNLKTFGLAVAIAASSISVSLAATPIDSLGLKYKATQNGIFSTSVTTAQSFWDNLTTAFNAEGFNDIYQSIQGIANNIGLYPTATVSYVAKKTDIGATSWTGYLTFNTATQTISFASGNLINASLVANPTVAVPGPEAGAGIGALMLGGMAYWYSRRRQPRAAAV